MGFVIGHGLAYSEPGEGDYMSSFYTDILVGNENFVGYSIKNYYSYDVKTPSSNMHVEPMFFNRLGFKIGYEISTLNPFGLMLGIEGGMIPNIFNESGVYGPGFPDDNIYFILKFGVALGFCKRD